MGKSAAPTDAVKREFARRLNDLIAERGWNQSELAREAAKHMPDEKFGRDNVSNYIRGRALPGVTHLTALAKALNTSPEELLDVRATTQAERNAPALDVREYGEGLAWLRVNQAVPWPKAMDIMRILKEES